MNGFEAYQRHVNPVLAQLEKMTGLDRRFVRAKGCRLWDDRDQAHLDMIAGHGSFNLGHNHPEIIAAIAESCAADLPMIYEAGISPHMGELARALTQAAGPPYEIVFFSNSGSEAVEGALKIARAATGRADILYCRNGYHGTTLGSLSMMAPGPWRDPFEPLLPGFAAIPFNDLATLEEKLRTRTYAALVTEPIQAEGGINVTAPDYLREAGELCREYGTLLIIDEIQTGLGRTGSFLAFQENGAVPDIFTVAKSLGGGIMPIGAYVTNKEVFERAYGTYELCMAHHSTFGGNSLCCRVAVRALELLTAPDFLAAARASGEYLLGGLRELCAANPNVYDIRGRGLLIGIEFNEPDHPWLSWDSLGLPGFTGYNPVPSLIMKQMMKQNILVRVCGHNWNVLKIEPPLTIERREIDEFLAGLEAALGWLGSVS